MHMGVQDERHVALLPVDPVAWSPPWIRTKQIVAVEPAAVEGIDVCLVGPTHKSGGVNNVHALA
jgi:hypothetical protein